MEKELDCQGLVCPEPVIRCRKLVNDERPSSLRVLVDNLAASENVRRFLGKNGYEVECEKKSETLWVVSGRASGCEIMTEEMKAPEVVSSNKTLVLITTETLGRGDDVLGQKLMENFLATLPELGEDLFCLVLVNGGVKLSATEGKALESLKKLALSGTKILVCGTCLGHYGLLEKKQVGETTNMLDIVSSLALATKVIRP